MLQFKWMNESSIEKAGDCWKFLYLWRQCGATENGYH